MEAYKVDTGQSKLAWHGERLDGTIEDGVIPVTGEVFVENGAITGGKFLMDMAMIESDKEEGKMKDLLEKHLKSEDFFEVEKYPEATFEITGVEGDEISGDLTIRGITKPIKFKADLSSAETGLEGRAKFAIDRSDWEVQYASGKFFKNQGDKLIKDEVPITLHIVANK